jgi:hypothetical protein
VFVAARQAVHDELAQLQAPPAPPVSTPVAAPNGPGPRHGSETRADGAPARTGGARGRSTKPATPSQVKAIFAIARAQHADLEGLLRDEYCVARPEDLSLADASKLIDVLKAAAAI